MSPQADSSSLARHYRDVRNRLNTIPAHKITDRAPSEMAQNPVVFSFSTFNLGLPISGFYGDGRWMTGVRRRVTMVAIINAVCQHFVVSDTDLRSSRRTEHLVRARQVAMHLCQTLTGATNAAIGKRLGNRDHTTVTHGLRKIKQVMHTDPLIKKAIDDLTAQFRRGA